MTVSKPPSADVARIKELLDQALERSDALGLEALGVTIDRARAIADELAAILDDEPPG